MSVCLRSSKLNSENKLNGNHENIIDTKCSSSKLLEIVSDSNQGSSSYSNPQEFLTANNNSGACNEIDILYVQCKWLNCYQNIISNNLLEHLKAVHVEPQKEDDMMNMFACRWESCKVYEQPSTLYSWLDRHVEKHIDGRKFNCIVEKCTSSFSSEQMLQRHIDSHFNTFTPLCSNIKKKIDSKTKRRTKFKTLKKNYVDFFDDASMLKINNYFKANYLKLSLFSESKVIPPKIIGWRKLSNGIQEQLLCQFDKAQEDCFLNMEK